MDSMTACDKCGTSVDVSLRETWMSGKTKSRRSDTYESWGNQVTETETTYDDFAEVEVFLCEKCWNEAAEEEKKESWTAAILGPPIGGFLLLIAFLLANYGPERMQEGAIVPGCLGTIFLVGGIVMLISFLVRPGHEHTPSLFGLAQLKAKAAGRDTVWTPEAYERLMKDQK